MNDKRGKSQNDKRSKSQDMVTKVRVNIWYRNLLNFRPLEAFINDERGKSQNDKRGKSQNNKLGQKYSKSSAPSKHSVMRSEASLKTISEANLKTISEANLKTIIEEKLIELERLSQREETF